MSNMRTRLVAGAGLVISLTGAAECLAQPCSILVKDSFRLGLRPHGGNGNLRNADLEDHLSGFWPQLPGNGVQWISSGAGAQFTWAFAMMQPEDPSDYDPIEHASGIEGCAFGEFGATALVPIATPTQAITASVNVALFGPNSDTAAFVGFATNASTLDNLATSGALWLALDNTDRWTIYANGGQVIRSGGLPGAFGAGVMESGVYNMQIRYDPVAGTVSGQIENLAIPATPVTINGTITHAAIEAHHGMVAANNFVVFTGEPISATGPAVVNYCEGNSVTFDAVVNDPDAVSAMRWHKDSVDGPLMMYDGVQFDGSIVTGANTMTLSITNTNASTAGSYRLFVAGACAMSFGTPTNVVRQCGPSCDSIDFNNDTSVIDPQDIDAFLSVYSEGPCIPETATCGDIDFNNDSSMFDPCDIDSFLVVFSEGPCSVCGV